MVLGDYVPNYVPTEALRLTCIIPDWEICTASRMISQKHYKRLPQSRAGHSARNFCNRPVTNQDLPVAMLDGLRMYDSDYGDSSDDSRLDVVPNASSSDDSTDNAGPVSVVVCHAKKV